MNRIPMTKKGFDMLNAELHRLENVDRIEVIREISSAREFGDLSENAEYRAAKDRQRSIEDKIAYLRKRISMAEVIDTAKFAGKKNIVFGAQVYFVNKDGESVTYKIVGDDESNIDEGKVSISSPIAKSLIGKKENDLCTMPNGDECHITKVEYNE